MMTTALPPHVHPGDSIRASAFNAVLDAIRSIMPIAGESVRISYTSAGAKIDAITQRRAASANTDYFHFGMTLLEGESSDSESADSSDSDDTLYCSITEGVVQIGGYTYFVDSNEDEPMEISGNGTEYICVKIQLSSGHGSFEHYGDAGNSKNTDDSDDSKNARELLREAQDDMDYYIFPIYKVVDGVKMVDYRPMPNAGCWETVVTDSDDSDDD